MEPPSKRLRGDNSVSATMLLQRADSDSDDDNTMELSETSRMAKQKHEELLRQVEALRKARTIIVPTKDETVRRRLRELHHPITLFGETAPGRRERLRAVMARLAVEGQLTAGSTSKQDLIAQQKAEAGKNAYVFEGTKELKAARMLVLQTSLTRAAKRLVAERNKYNVRKEGGEEADQEEIRRITALEKRLRNYANTSSEIGDTRPISSCHFQPSSKLIATSSWSGYCKIWTTSDSALRGVLRNHDDSRVNDIKFNPLSGVNLSEDAANLATCDVDNKIYLWAMPSNSSCSNSEEKMEDEEEGKEEKKDLSSAKNFAKSMHCLEGHKLRCSKLAWLPNGRHLVSTSFDCTWRLWDINTQQQILLQRGHSRPTYGCAVQCDGALIATGDLGGNCRLWDARVGKSLMPLKGHTKQVLCVDFAPNGYMLASGSGDNTVRVWDLRKRECLYTIPGHHNMISSVKWEPVDGHYLVTGGYDNVAKVWSANDFQLLKTLAGHESRVMGVDIAPDLSCVATASFDRTFKTWSFESSSEFLDF